LRSLIGVWILSGAWLWRRRSQVLIHARLAWLLPYVALLILSSCMSLEPRWWWDDRYDLRSMVSVLSMSATLTGFIWLCTKDRSWRALLFIFGMLVTAPGAALAGLASWHIAAGANWSPFSDPRPGQIHAQYPLRWNEVWTFIPVILLAGAALLIASLLIPRSNRGSKGPGSGSRSLTPSPSHPLTVSSLTPASSPPPSPSPSPPGSALPSRPPSAAP
jgi:hypothetical protein